MKNKEDSLSFFVSFCVEQYKSFSHQSGAEVAAIFEKSGVLDYLISNYEILHTQGARWLVEEIDSFINKDKC